MKSHKKIEAQLPMIRSMGNLLFDPVWSERRHMSGENELLHVISGEVTVVMKRHRIAARPGDTLLIPSKTPHRDDFDISSKLEVFMVHFSWPWEKEFFSMVSHAALPALPAPQKEAVAHLVHHLRLDFATGSPQHDLLAKVRLFEILVKILEVALNQDRHRKTPDAKTDYGRQRREWILGQAKSYIEDNFSRTVSLEEIAKHLRVSPYHLSHIFSAENDFSLFEFLTHLRMKKARSLLEEGKLTIAETAYAVGFNNSNYFTKVFHRYYGFPPTQLHRRRMEFRKV